MKIIIIGGIAAGMSAAAKLRRVDKEVEVMVIEKQSYISFGACGLPYYVGNFFEDQERMLVRTPEQARAMGIDIRLESEVIGLDVTKKELQVKTLTTGEITCEPFDKLMIATGARAAMPPITNSSLDHIYQLRTLEDGNQLRKKLAEDGIHRIGIIGAGFIGLEVVDAVKNLGKEVVIFQQQSRILDQVFDQEITDLLEEELRSQGVQLYLNAMVTGFEGEETVQAILSNQGRVQVDAVVVATGVLPNTEFLKDTGIQRLPNGAIIIDEEGRTSIPDIYAAGDCATVPHRLKDEPSYLPLATTANKIGRIVGENLAGNHERFEGTLGSSCLKVLDLEAGCTGLTESEAKRLGLKVKSVFITDKNHTDYYPGQEKLSIKLVYEEQTKVILGGQVVGKSDAVQRTNVIATAIFAKMTTKQLGMMDFCYAPPFARTWDALNIAGNAAK